MTIDRIDKGILTYLTREDWPDTTEMVAKMLVISWNTAQLHLYKLVSEGLVKGKRVGRQNQWTATDKGKDASKQRAASTSFYYCRKTVLLSLL